jgi:hypothetical protein
MDVFEASMARKWDGSHEHTAFATELLFANGNAGEALLTASTMQINLALLDRLQAMGVKGVVLAIKYPLLMPEFPRSSEYLKFFKDIMAECRKRNIKVLVECGAIFAGTPYSPVKVDWSKYTAQTFLQGLQDQLVMIAREIKPDYLTLANEPQTEEGLTKLIITPAVWADFVNSAQKKVDRSGGMLVGAGTGTWEDRSYIEAIMNMPGLDYIDLHLYPMGKDAALLERGYSDAMAARAAGKRVTVSECWLYKAAPDELVGSGGLGNANLIMNRDYYSFWGPLDSRFLRDMMDLADATKMDFISFFWMRYFFAYLDYEKIPRGISTEELNHLITPAAANAVLKGNLSTLGQYYQQQLAAR